MVCGHDLEKHLFVFDLTLKTTDACESWLKTTTRCFRRRPCLLSRQDSSVLLSVILGQSGHAPILPRIRLRRKVRTVRPIHAPARKDKRTTRIDANASENGIEDIS